MIWLLINDNRWRSNEEKRAEAKDKSKSKSKTNLWMPTLAGLVWQTRLSRRERRPAAQDTAKKKHCIHSHDGDLAVLRVVSKRPALDRGVLHGAPARIASHRTTFRVQALFGRSLVRFT
ncbi:(6-4)DNA photolyase [Fusarium oxysporum f. sp. albedinis]|nr:(6-4)DNA photolyase [Fusarium oxysporum f. sp. albedinis]